MIIFGLGTIPALTALLTTSHLFPAHWRGAGTKLAAITVILTGIWMAVRSTVDLCGGHIS